MQHEIIVYDAGSWARINRTPAPESLEDAMTRVARYLPGNYSVTGIAAADEDPTGLQRVGVRVHGTDNAGWTLEEYVIPRLASGLMAVAVLPPDPCCTDCYDDPQDGARPDLLEDDDPALIWGA